MAGAGSEKKGWARVADQEAMGHLREGVVSGREWHTALLEAIGLWASPEETAGGRHYRYLIDGEAFDWLLLAERLVGEVKDAVPEQEYNDLVFDGRLPVDVSDDEFKGLIGTAKYHAYLNFLYGIIAERFLLAAVEEEICKERNAQLLRLGEGDEADGYIRLYGLAQDALLRQFREERAYRHQETVALNELQEFTYWLFKYRLTNSDKAKVASDTKKAMDYLARQRSYGDVAQRRKRARFVIEHKA